MSQTVTQAQVIEKMKQLGIEGWSSMSTFMPAEHMTHLETIENMLNRRRATTRQLNREDQT